MFDESIKGGINKSIELLIRSADKFECSKVLLLLALIKQFGNETEIFKNEIDKIKEIPKYLSKNIIQMFVSLQLFNKSKFEILYESYRTKDFIYNMQFEPVETSELQNKSINKDVPETSKAKNISNVFYDGFGYDLL